MRINSDRSRLAFLLAGTTSLLAISSPLIFAGVDGAWAQESMENIQDKPESGSLDEMWKEHEKDLTPASSAAQSGSPQTNSAEPASKSSHKKKPAKKNRLKKNDERSELNGLPPGMNPDKNSATEATSAAAGNAASSPGASSSTANDVSSGATPGAKAGNTDSPSASKSDKATGWTDLSPAANSTNAAEAHGSTDDDQGKTTNTTEAAARQTGTTGTQDARVTQVSGEEGRKAAGKQNSLKKTAKNGTGTNGRERDSLNSAKSKPGDSSGATSPGGLVDYASGSSTGSKTNRSATEERGTASSGTPQTVSEPASDNNSPSHEAVSADPEAGFGAGAPLCKLSALAASDFVRTGGWPGVGPFSKDKGKETELVDEGNNRLRLKLSGDQITHAELKVVNQSTKPSQLLSLQMTTDFLLEALGAQSGRIADFNTELEKNQEKLIASSPDAKAKGQVNLKAGSYIINITRQQPGEDTVPGNASYLISVDNDKPLTVASAVPPASTRTRSGKEELTFTVRTTIAPDTSSENGTESSTTSANNTSSTQASKPADDLLKRQFINVIEGWQRIKRTAMKSRQSGNLTRILGGKALETQNQALRWLLDKHLYYEMTPMELKVQSYKAVVPQSKYEVLCFIKEKQQLMSADTMQPAKEAAEKSYKVVYTVEKIRGAWLITNSLVSP